MYGVPPDLDLSRFHGATLLEIAVGAFQVRLRFEQPLEVAIEGDWEVHERDGAISSSIDRLRTVVGKSVISTEVRAPRSIVLDFDGGTRVEIYDSAEHYESFSIEPGPVIV